jgi:hypothetical protein
MRCGYETTFILGVVETNHDRNYGGGEGDDGAANSGMSIGGTGSSFGEGRDSSESSFPSSPKNAGCNRAGVSNIGLDPKLDVVIPISV